MPDNTKDIDEHYLRKLRGVSHDEWRNRQTPWVEMAYAIIGFYGFVRASDDFYEWMDRLEYNLWAAS